LSPLLAPFIRQHFAPVHNQYLRYWSLSSSSSPSPSPSPSLFLSETNPRLFSDITQARRDAETCRSTIIGLRHSSAVSSSSHLDSFSAASDCKQVERLQHAEALKRAATSIASLEADAARSTLELAQKMAAARDELRIVAAQRDALQSHVNRLKEANGAAAASVSAAAAGQRQAEGELSVIEDELSTARAKAAYAERSLGDAKALIFSLQVPPALTQYSTPPPIHPGFIPHCP